MTASIYLRRSKRPGEKSVSMAFQEAEIRELCARLGHDVVSVHSDTVSGALTTRPGFRAWLADAGDVDLLAAWAIDRTTRSGILGAAAIMEAIEPTSTRFMTVDGLDSEQPGFGMNLAIRAEIAREERMRVVERSRSTRKRLLSEGRHASGPPPYGTRVVDGRLAPDEAEKAVLREVAQRLLRGHGVRAVLRWLNDEGHTTRRGNPWTRSSLVTTLESEASRTHIFTLAESRALAERLHPKPGTRRPGGRPVTWLLSGWATCAGCGRPVTTSRDAQRDVTRYVCPTTTSVAPCPARVTIRADRADEVVAQRFLDDWGDLNFWDEVVTVDGTEVDEAERARDEAQAALLTEPTEANLAAYQAAAQTLEQALAKPAVKVTKVVPTEVYRVQWEKADPSGRAALLQQAYEGVEITKSTGPRWDPERIRIHPRD